MKILETNILDIQFGTIIHAVNCKGVWGAGLAAQIKLKYPKAFEEYKEFLFKSKKSWRALGNIVIHRTPDINIISCFTQYDVGVTSRKTEYSAVKLCMEQVSALSSVYIPYKFGCGLGGGDWDIVSDIIETYLPRAIICKHG